MTRATKLPGVWPAAGSVVLVTPELAPSRWEFPSPTGANADGLVGVGADLEPTTLIAAYRKGIFPMPIGDPAVLGWWSPDPRGILPLDAVHVSRSLAAARRRFDFTIDTAFDRVVERCAGIDRPGGWITDEIIAAYGRLHELGWAHSFEVWSADGSLAGGLYGVAIGGLFAGESMFHEVSNASKVALVGAVEVLRGAGASLFDVQWTTPHLASLGAIDVSRDEYLKILHMAVSEPTDWERLRV